MFLLTDQPLENIDLREGINTPASGAFSCFEGLVRNHNEGHSVSLLEYEADAILCDKEAAKILDEARSRFNIHNVKAYHRVGKLNIGEMAVWVGVTSAHRDDSFKACRYVIDEIKHRLPIWKKEYYSNGNSGWVNCEGCSHKTKIDDHKFYSRQTILNEIGAEGQHKLKTAKVLVIGAGGLGSPVLQSLAGAGVGHIGLVEYDTLDESNLHRQHLYKHSDIGQPKIELAEQAVHSLNPSVKLEPFAEQLTAHNIESIIEEYDLLIDCTDNFKTKYLLNDAAVLKQKPLIQASVYQFEGQIRIYIPERSACLRCLWPDMPHVGSVGTCAQAGVIGAVPSIVGHWQAMIAIKIILNIGTVDADQSTLINCLNNEQQKIKHSIDPNCPVCGLQPRITTIDERNYEMSTSPEIKFEDLDLTNLDQYVFLDVREDHELMVEPIKSVKCEHLPLSEYDGSNYDFDASKTYIIFCAKGVRSLNVTEYLREKGINNTFSLIGGTDSLIKYEYINDK